MTAATPLKRHFAKTLAFIKQSIAKNGYSPTVREIMVGRGVSSTAVIDYHLRRLRAHKRITWKPNTARTIRVLEGES